MFEKEKEDMIITENKKATSEEVLEKFKLERGIYEKIKEIGIEAYVESLPDLKKAFEKDLDKQAGCIDEGMPGAVETHLAGSGILLSEKEFEKFIKEAGVETITSHDGCGAAKLYAIKKGLDVNLVDEIYKDWAKEQAEKYGLKYRHISATEMVRPKEGHIAGTCYCDYTASLTNWDQVEGLPSGFIVSRKALGKNNALKDIILSIEIAFGDHGLGNLLTEENPFLLLVVASNQEQLNEAIDELSKIDHNYSKRVKIEGFLA